MFFGGAQREGTSHVQKNIIQLLEAMTIGSRIQSKMSVQKNSHTNKRGVYFSHDYMMGFQQALLNMFKRSYSDKDSWPNPLEGW